MTTNGAITNVKEFRHWPSEGLEDLGECPVCRSPRRSLMHESLEDSVYFSAPGQWNFWCCEACGSGYLDPRPSAESIHLAYENYYTHDAQSTKQAYLGLSSLRRIRRKIINGYLSARFGSCERPAWRWAKFLIWIMIPIRRRLDREYRHLPQARPESRVLLDFGSGNGDFLKLAESCGWTAYGVDPDPEAAATALRSNLRVVCGGIEAAEQLGIKFDVITMNHVLEHLHNPVDTLRRCKSLLNADGVLWLEFPRVHSRGHKRFGRHWRGLECPRHLVLPSLRGARQVLADIGFVGIRELPRPSSVRSMYAASRAMSSGLSPHGQLSASIGDSLEDFVAIALEALGLQQDEMITLTCRSDGSIQDSTNL